MIRRPKPGESDEDLLKFQREFLASQSESSATLVKRAEKRKPDATADDSRKDVVQIGELPSKEPKMDTAPSQSRFRQNRNEIKGAKELEEDPEERLDKHDFSAGAVLSKIIERDTRNAAVGTPMKCTQGFPSVFHRGQITEATNQNPQKKKKSLFAQQFAKMSARDFGVMLDQEKAKEEKKTASRSQAMASSSVPSTSSVDSGSLFSGKSAIVEGTGLSATFGKDEVHKIHQENVQKLTSMSQEEILAEQQKLLEMLDPSMLSFLKSRKSTKKEESVSMETDMQDDDTRGKKITSDSIQENIGEDDLPVKPQKDWVHMDKIEYDKLSWMKDLPPPGARDVETGQQARFDFHGNLVPPDMDIPVNVGLHHHGEDPERAGYTLEELFHLSRSSNIQQRILALKTVGNVLQKAKNSDLEQLIQTPILPAVLDAGVMFLLRWALDDSVDSVVMAAVSAVHSLLVSEADELSLDRTFSWFQGHLSPSHKPADVDIADEGDEEKPQDTDADLLKKDVILCLVTRMNFLPRLKYILVKTKPQAPTVIQILGLLTRCVRHSPSLAYEVEKSLGLIELVVEEFLPTSWRLIDENLPLSDLYGVPVPAALNLMRTLAQSGRNMASMLISRYHIQSRLLRYLVEEDHRNLQLPEVEAFKLQVEGFRLWRTLLCYGLAVDLFIDLYPSLLSRLNKIKVDSYSLESQQEILVAMIGALEMAVHVASSCDGYRARFIRRQDGDSVEVEGMTEFAVPVLNWSHVAELVHMVTKLTQTLLQKTGNEYQFKKFNLDLPAACINFVASYFTAWSSHSSFDPVKGLQEIEHFCMDSFIPSFKTIGMQTVFDYVSQFSSLLSSSNSQNKEHSENLPGLGSSFTKGDNSIPVLQELSPIGSIVAVLRLVYSMCQIHKGLQKQVVPLFVNDQSLCSYHRKIAHLARPGHLHGNYFVRYENLLQYFYLKLASLMSKEDLKNVTILQSVALNLLTRLGHGDEFLVHDLLSTIMYNSNFLCSGEEEVRTAMEGMKLSNTTHLKSATQEEISFTQEQLLSKVKANLSAIRSTYLKSLSQKEKIAIHSRHRFKMRPLEIQSLMTSSFQESLLPTDWMFMPLIELYNKFSSVGSDLQNALSSGEVATVTNVLQWIYLLERVQPEIMNSISITLKISRIMCTFLTGNDLFLDKSVYSYLAALLREYTKPKLLDQMDFEEDIPGLTSFYDLYVALLQQYEAVSFGDTLFGCYILVPWQQKHNLQLRKAVWTEHYGILRILHLPVKESLIPIDRYLEPEETDAELIRLYFQGLLSQRVRPTWAPIVYLSAIHHVNRFIYNQENKHLRLKHLMLKQALHCKNQELRRHLLYYKLADSDKEFGMDLYGDLPQIRKSLLQTLE